ncbi:MAG: galactose mutarotase [Pseudobutyrivibrio sp.]|nr:galactose mutarotase [Pseudobutyrivibrio sp.]
MEKERLGVSPSGEEIFAYTLVNEAGMQAKIMNYGCNLLELWVPDKDGILSDVVLGYEKIEDYFVNSPGFGCCVTPNANRIGGASFTLNGKTYEMEKNDGNNNLHSGSNPIHREIWEVKDVDDKHITFTYHKKAGQCDLPADMDLMITYTLSDNNALAIDYMAKAAEDTLFNPTNHSYFNLGGHDAGNAMNQIVWLDADKFTRADNESIPHGQILPVKGTPMDFTTPKAPAVDTDTDYDQLNWAGGYDHNYVLNNPSLSAACASLTDPVSGRKMEVYTDLPGMQLYCGNYLSPEHIGKGGYAYQRRDGLCFESQYFPNAINVPEFDQPIAKAGVETKTTTIFKFSNI